MIRLRTIAKSVLVAGMVVLVAYGVLKANQLVYTGPIAYESALAYNKTYSLNTANYGIDYLSTQITYSSATVAALSFTDGTQSTGSITVTSLTNINGKQGTNTITVSTQASLSGATINLGGVTLTEGRQWYTQSSTNAVATSIKTGINTYVPNFIATTTGNRVNISCVSSGTWCNTVSLSVSVSSLTAGAALFAGGVDNSVVAINNVTLIQGRDWTSAGTSTATAKAISDAILANTSLNSVVSSTWGATLVGVSTIGVVFATSTSVGTSTTYALFSSSQAALTLSGSVTTDSTGRGTSAMTGGTASAVTLNSPIISVANLFTPKDQNQTGMVGLPVLYTASTAKGGLTTGTTYFVIPISVSQFELALTSTGAVAGTYITITSSSAQTTAHSYTLSPLALTGTTTFQWQGSNDGSSWFNVATSSAVAASGFIAGGNTTNNDFGAYGYTFIRLSVTAPTAGGVNMKATLNGRKQE